MNWQFYIQYTVTTAFDTERQVYPVGDNDMKWGPERTKGFRWREIFGDRVQFREDQGDYTVLLARDRNAEIKFIVRHDCDSYGSDVFTGYFSIIDGKWNEDDCTFEVPITTDDDYRTLTEAGDTVLNVIKTDYSDESGNGEWKVGDTYSLGQRVTRGGTVWQSLINSNTGNTPVEGANWTDVLNLTVGVSIPSQEVEQQTACTGNLESYMNSNPLTLPDHWDYYIQMPASEWKVGTAYVVGDKVLEGGNPYICISDNTGNTPVLPGTIYWAVDVCSVDPVSCSPGVEWEFTVKKFWVNFDPSNAEWVQNIPGEWSIECNNTEITGTASPDCGTIPTVADTFISKGFRLKYLIQYILFAYNTSLVYKSTFFENDTVVGGGSGGTANNVTGVAPNPLNDQVMAQKSDCLGRADDATIGEISFNELMDWIFDMYKAEWIIDADGNFRIEHYNYFDSPAAGDDLVTDFPSFIVKTNRYEFEKEKMHNRERFTWMESKNEDFVGLDIQYDRIATNNRFVDNILEHNLTQLTTDIAYIKAFPEDISLGGWVIMVVSGANVANEVGKLSLLSQINGHLSWANLQEAYWTYGGILWTCLMNKGGKKMNSVRRNQIQVAFSYPKCCNAFDFDETIKTDLGDGLPLSAKFTKDGMVLVELAYKETEPTAAGIGTQIIETDNIIG